MSPPSLCSISTYLLSFSLLLSLMILARGGATETSSGTTTTSTSEQFEFQRFDDNTTSSTNFKSQITLSGDARVEEGGGGGGGTSSAALQITGNWNSSSGRVTYKNPIKLADPKNPRLKYSFGTHFTFSISPEPGDGLAFVLVPDDEEHEQQRRGSYQHHDGTSFDLRYELVDRKTTAFAVEFDTRMDPEYGDMNANHIGIDVGGLVSVKATNAYSSRASVVLNSGKKLKCWIDYEASSKRVEVRLVTEDDAAVSDADRPIDPVLSCPIDLSEMFRNRRVLVALSSSNGNSTQVARVFSWGFRSRAVPYWTHSQPLDPEVYKKDGVRVPPQTTTTRNHRRGECAVRVVTAVLVGTACGALGAFLVLLVWSVIGNRRRPVVPEELVVDKYAGGGDKVKVFVVADDTKPKKNSDDDQVRIG